MLNSSPIWIAVIVGAVAGLTLTILALRGRLVHARPTCRKCRFDLSGLPTPADPAVRRTCPECGQDLSHPRAIRPGLRHTRRVMLAAGLLLLLTSISAGVFFTVTRGNIKLNTYKPAWMLEMETRSPDSARAAAALDELVLRASGTSLSTARLNRLVAEALRRQTDEVETWMPQWANIVAEARKVRRVDDASWGRFLRNGVKFDLVVRPRVRQGEQSTVSIRFTGARLGGADAMVYVFQTGMKCDDQPLQVPAGHIATVNVGGTGISMAGRPVTFDAPVGQRTLASSIKIAILDRLPEGVSDPDVWAPEYASFNDSLTLTAPIQIVPPGTPLVKLIEPTDSSRAAMARAISVSELVMSPKSAANPTTGFSYTIRAVSSPYPAAFDLTWRWTNKDGSTHQSTQGSVLFGQGGGDSFYGGGVSFQEFDADAVDLILRPSIPVAEQSNQLDALWNGELTITNVRYTLPPTEAPPTAAGGPGTGIGGEPPKH